VVERPWRHFSIAEARMVRSVRIEEVWVVVMPKRVDGMGMTPSAITPVMIPLKAHTIDSDGTRP
jgi:hypothetical protein